MLFKTAIAGLTFVALVPTSAGADQLDGAYRGMIVCEKLQTSQFMLRAPLDITISGKNAIAARPIFNRLGTRVVGSEIATGTVGDDGAIKLSSNWKAGGASYQGSYGGMLTGKGGTLTGTQAWTMPEGQQSRACTAAVIQTRS
ncbi:MAG TPA: hypothetical protein VFW22_02590 [Pseudolabrys sp.]|nr:hypothetical protein [Pseudolabrys sp.]